MVLVGQKQANNALKKTGFPRLFAMVDFFSARFLMRALSGCVVRYPS
jgi:hypothetical protein